MIQHPLAARNRHIDPRNGKGPTMGRALLSSSNRGTSCVANRKPKPRVGAISRHSLTASRDDRRT